MSRIADVLKKAKEENAEWKEPPVSSDLPDLESRSIADVNVPWSFPDAATYQAPSPSLHLAAPVQPRVVPAVPLPVKGAREVAGDQAIASLVHAVFFASGESPNRRVLFTSVDASPSADEVVVRVGRALAVQAAQPVYLVDMNLERPSLHKQFDIDGRRGFSNALTDELALIDVAQLAESDSNLWVVPGGLQTEKQRPALGDAATHHRIRTMMESANYVIAYTAPIGGYSDAELIGKLFDGVVLVVKTGVTTSEALRRAANSLQAAKARLLGTLLETDPV